ncbi:hypothetical protein PLEOSDRAFT_166772 [Pleurotus ostreatus PC15]|uniref:SUN domain-containing protein n=1 Tax=Pleurotus ostreatus (strain PC15) TaxID=1137138 RepID=A0A067NNH8_PLEO1|nr:hypothetical protein PLEOSDRAFT_166772 [Pleurotus ostreatus PC15]
MHHVSDADRRQINSVSDLLCIPLVIALEFESMQAPLQESDPRLNFRITTSDLPVVANPLGYIVRRERSNSLDEDDEHEVLRVTSEQRGQLLAQSQRIEEATDICKALEIHHRNILERSESLQRSFQLHDTILDDLTTRLVSVSLQVEEISRTSETQGQQYAQVENLKTQIEYLSTGLQRTASILEEVTREVASLREQLAWIVPQVENTNNFAREWKEADWARSEAAKKAGESEATLLGLQHRTSELENDYQSLYSLAREWKEATRERNDVIEKVSEAGATWFQLQHRIAVLEDRYRSLENQTLSDELQADRPDFALSSAGARVIPAWTTPTLKLTTSSRSWLPSFFHSPRFGNLPEFALQPDLHNGNCWPFAGEVGQLAIALARPIYVQEVVIEHIPRQLSFDISSAPMDMELWGVEEGPPPPSTWPSSMSEEGADTSDSPTLPRGTSSLLIAQFRYDVAAASPSQTFTISSHLAAIRFQSVVLRIKNNWGNYDYTCLYGIRIHGTIAT